MEAGVYSVRSVFELHQMVFALAQEGFRIITVIDTHNGDYHVVAQKDDALAALDGKKVGK